MFTRFMNKFNRSDCDKKIYLPTIWDQNAVTIVAFKKMLKTRKKHNDAQPFLRFSEKNRTPLYLGWTRDPARFFVKNLTVFSRPFKLTVDK